MSQNCLLCLNYYLLKISAPFGLNGFEFRCSHFKTKSLNEIKFSKKFKIIPCVISILLLAVLIYDSLSLKRDSKKYPLLIFIMNITENLITSNTILMMFFMSQKNAMYYMYQNLTALIRRMENCGIAEIFNTKYIAKMRNYTKLYVFGILIFFFVYILIIASTGNVYMIIKQIAFTLCFFVLTATSLRITIECNNYVKVFEALKSEIRKCLNGRLYQASGYARSTTTFSFELRKLIRLYQAVYKIYIMSNDFVNPNLLLWFIIMTTAVVLNIYTFVQFMIDQQFEILTIEHFVTLCRTYFVLMSVLFSQKYIEKVSNVVSLN